METIQNVYQAKTSAEASTMLQELQRRAATARDLIIPTHEVGMTARDAMIAIPGPFGSMEAMPLSPNAHRQLGTKLDIPRAYYQRMQEAQPELLSANVNTWLQSTDEKNMLWRMMDGRVRAVLSDRYRPYDTADLAFSTLQKATSAGAQISRFTLTDDRFEMRLIQPQWEESLTYPESGIDARYGSDGGHRIGRAMGRLIPGCYVSNSETGNGGLSIRPFILDMVCSNGMISEESFRRIHLGQQQDAGYLSIETRKAKDATMWLEVADLVTAVFDRERFQTLVEELRGTATRVLAEPIAAVENVVKNYGLTEDDKQAILNELISPSHDRDPGRTVFGLISAVTERAKAYRDTNPDQETALEIIGYELAKAPETMVAIRR